ncbi:Vitamin B12 transporter BtuB [Tannerella forsythia]|uniref:Vitamin B12 transporter BtuB n=1 Tax=Tannerella forsythia TaxID=28112 RepID=A0A1D3UQ19_TANFO|nr:Vitamin B12 transporter BtuB [Tannerella forsythia]
MPGLFTTSRGVMGYGVSNGAAGGISLRGLSGDNARLMVLIDGHPQYAGIFGHPIADAYQTLLADQVEVLRGPASVLYGSDAMGGVINIVTRKMHEDGVRTHLHTGYGSYNTLETELTNRIRKERFSGVLCGSYNRTDGHCENMPFEQYSGYVKLGYELTDNWNTYADVNVTHFNATYPGPISTPLLEIDGFDEDCCRSCGVLRGGFSLQRNVICCHPYAPKNQVGPCTDC